jgi:hypothetical protein
VVLDALKSLYFAPEVCNFAGEGVDQDFKGGDNLYIPNIYLCKDGIKRGSCDVGVHPSTRCTSPGNPVFLIPVMLGVSKQAGWGGVTSSSLGGSPFKKC